MNFFKLTVKSFKYFLKGNLAIASGVALTAAVITGALLVGDSVRYSLEQNTRLRLGEISHTISGQDRIFTKSLSQNIGKEIGLPVASALYTRASALTGGGARELSNVQIWGLDEEFSNLNHLSLNYDSLADNEAVINQNTAERLAIDSGEYVLLRIKKPDVIPPNTPFAAEDQTLSKRYKVKAVIGDRQLGRLNMRQSQSAAFNVFVNYKSLSRATGQKGKANMIFIAGKPDADIARITKAMHKAQVPADANLKIRKLPDHRQNEIISERVFIDSASAEKISRIESEKQEILSYFVNTVRLNDKFIPYSFVSAFSKSSLKPDEIILNRWAADDLNAAPGDSLWLSYFTVGPMKHLETDSAQFLIKKIVPVEGFFADKKLMPNIPGLSDAGSCSDWDTGVPVDLEKIRDKDENYWNRYRGTPKAFIGYEKGRELWSNRFGAHTAFRFPARSLSRRELEKQLARNIRLRDYGITVKPVLKKGMAAARGGVDFGELFLALSFFIIVSGILLIVLFFKFHIDQRSKQIGLYSALGYPDRLILKIIVSEQALTAFIGAFAGIFLALLYNHLVFSALNTLWQDVVRTNLLITKIYPHTLLIGFVLSFAIALISQYFVMKRMLKQQSADLQKQTLKYRKRGLRILHKILLFLLPAATLILLTAQFAEGDIQKPAVFFAAGAMLLLFFVLLTARGLQVIEKKSYRQISFTRLAAKNAVRNPMRSLLTIILLSIGTFLVISTGMNKQDVFSDAQKKSSGTGGFLYFTESTVPVLKNLNRSKVKKEFSLETTDSVVQFKVFEGEDAGCLNLNRVNQPRILAVNPELLKGRFSFVTKTKHLDTENPWQSLNAERKNYVPAIADQTVIKWGLGKETGDTLHYIDSRGDSLKLLLIGGLKASVFQGNVIISQKHFNRLFPYSDGSKVFLIEGKFSDSTRIKKELDLAFADYGLNIEYTANRLAEFKSVTNTYLSIFLVLGAIGLLFGIIGLAVITARSIRQRRSETALLRSVGWSNAKIFRLYFMEYSVLMFIGIIGGTAAAFVAALPGILSPNTDSAPGFVLLQVVFIIFSGTALIAAGIYAQLKALHIRPALQADA